MSNENLLPVVAKPTDVEVLHNVVDTSALIARRAQINQVLEEVMVEGTHYDTLPGTNTPTLLQPGAQVLASTFQIAPTYGVEDLGDADHFRYRVVCRGIQQNTLALLGEGLGEASTLEEKYMWRQAAVAAEYDATPEDRRREKYYRGNDRPVLQVRQWHHDQANTVLKMAGKRAYVAMILNVLGASDMFTQDEDVVRDGGDGPTGPSRPRASGTGHTCSDAQLRMMRGKLSKAGKEEADLVAYFELQQLEDMPKSQVNDALAWIES